MIIKEKEFSEIREEFEKIYKYENLEHEPEYLAEKEIYYMNGQVNHLFIAFKNGYYFALNNKKI